MSKTLFKTCLLSLAVITLAACGQKEETTTTEAPTTVAETTVAETTVAETTVAESEEAAEETVSEETASEETSEVASDEASEEVSADTASDESAEASSEEVSTTADETTTAEETTVAETTSEATTTEATETPAVAPVGSEEAGSDEVSEEATEETNDESIDESSSGEAGANGDETQLAPIPERSQQIIMEDDKAFDKLLEDSKEKTQILYVGFEECPFCKEFVHKLNTATEKAQVKFHYYNTDYRGQDANFGKVIGEFLQISTVPHAFLIKDGKVVEKLTSDAKETDFEAFVKKATEN